MKPIISRTPTSDGGLLVVYADGSYVKLNMMTGAVMDQNDDPNPQRAAALGAGDTSEVEALKDKARIEDRYRFDRQWDMKADEISQNYKVNMLNARTQQDQQRATAQYQQDQIQLQRERLSWDREKGQADLGMRGVETLANLRGPENYFASSNYARGFANLPGSSGFLSALQNNTRLPGFGGPSGAPQGETGATLLAKLQGGGSGTIPVGGSIQGGNATAANGAPAPGTAAGAYLGQIHALGAAGGGKIGAGMFEQLTPSEQKLFVSGLGTTDAYGAAFDPDQFLDAWRRSRIGQNVSGNAFKSA